MFFFFFDICLEIYQKKNETVYKRKILLCYNLENKKNIRSLFNFKDKTSHVQSVVYERKTNYGENYIGETGWNIIIRWDEHSDIGKNSEPASTFINYLNTALTGKSLEISK